MLLADTMAGLIDYSALIYLKFRNKAKAAYPGKEAMADITYTPVSFELPDNISTPTLASFNEEISYPSPVQSKYIENNTVYIHPYIPEGNNWQSPTVIYLPQWNAINVRFHSLFCRRIARWGYNTLFCETPYHLKRTPEGYHSGELALLMDLEHSMQSYRQAVLDVRVLVQALQQQGCQNIGIMGSSLGGNYAALLAACEPALKLAILNVPACELFNLLSQTNAGKTIVKDFPLDQHKDQLQKLLMSVTPANYQPVIPTHKILITNGIYDRIIKPDFIRSLHKAWQGSQLAELPYGHTLMCRGTKPLFTVLHGFLDQHMPNNKL